MDDSSEIERILRKIYQSRPLGKKNRLDCFVCGNRSNHYRANETEKGFCSQKCHELEHLAAQYFHLGMKRSARVIEIVPEDDGDDFEWSFIYLPNEIQALVILFAFQYKIETPKEWIRLNRIRLLLNKQSKTIVENLVLPNLQYIDPRVLSNMENESIEKLIGLRKLKLPKITLENVSLWNEMLTKMKNLLDLDISLPSKGNQILRTMGLENLTRLACGNNTTDENLNGLVNLSTLALFNDESPITDKGLGYVSNITALELGSDGLTLWDFNFTPSGLFGLHSLQKIVFTNFNLGLLNGDHFETIAGIRELHLIRSEYTSIDSFTNLEVLKMKETSGLPKESRLVTSNLTKLSITLNRQYNNQVYLKNLLQSTRLEKLKLSGIDTPRTYGQTLINLLTRLVNLEKLDLTRNREINDKCVSLLTSLRSLNLDYNKEITDKGISTLTNLTFISLVENGRITNRSLRKLQSLRLIREKLRTYRRQSDNDITFY